MIILDKIPGTNILMALKYDIDYNNTLVKLIEGDTVINYKNKIKLYGNVYEKDIEWLIHVMVYNIRLQTLTKEEIASLVFKPVKFKNKKEEWLRAFPFFNNPIEKTIGGILYRRSARYLDYGVSSNGDVINWKSLTKLEVRFSTQYNYPNFNIQDRLINQKTSILADKLVALTWVDSDDYVLHNTIAHKDNDKRNYKASNLQWVNENLK